MSTVQDFIIRSRNTNGKSPDGLSGLALCSDMCKHAVGEIVAEMNGAVGSCLGFGAVDVFRGVAALAVVERRFAVAVSVEHIGTALLDERDVVDREGQVLGLSAACENRELRVTLSRKTVHRTVFCRSPSSPVLLFWFTESKKRHPLRVYFVRKLHPNGRLL